MKIEISEASYEFIVDLLESELNDITPLTWEDYVKGLETALDEIVV